MGNITIELDYDTSNLEEFYNQVIHKLYTGDGSKEQNQTHRLGRWEMEDGERVFKKYYSLWIDEETGLGTFRQKDMWIYVDEVIELDDEVIVEMSFIIDGEKEIVIEKDPEGGIGLGYKVRTVEPRKREEVISNYIKEKKITLDQFYRKLKK